MRLLLPLILLVIGVYGLDNGLGRTPPMGWMSWTAFYCEIDCQKHPTGCINEQLYKDMADQLGEWETILNCSYSLLFQFPEGTINLVTNLFTLMTVGRKWREIQMEYWLPTRQDFQVE